MRQPHPDTILVRGETYSHIKTREFYPISIYRGDTSFLRIGPQELLCPELELHKKLIRLEFPVSQLLDEGKLGELFFYRESSLGTTHLGEVFRDEFARTGQVSDGSFQKFLLVSTAFAKAQLRTATPISSFESLCTGIHAHELTRELPHLEKKINSALDKVNTTTRTLPTVFTHGDLNPFNLFEGGVIDFGDSFKAPAGYDLVSNAYHTYLFPTDLAFERLRGYEFAPRQIREYFDSIDAVYQENGLPKLSNFSNTFIFCRTIWSSAKMHSYPKIQSWRYAQFERVLEVFIADGSLVQEIVAGHHNV